MRRAKMHAPAPPGACAASYAVHAAALGFFALTVACALAPVSPASCAPRRRAPFTLMLPGGVPLVMLPVEAGGFVMGDVSDEDWWKCEVTLTQRFLLGKYEVAQAQYEAVMGANPSRFKRADHPVESVFWGDAAHFCDEVNRITEGKRPAGFRCTLPTEAQWEYACRAGIAGAYSFSLRIGSGGASVRRCPHRARRLLGIRVCGLPG